MADRSPARLACVSLIAATVLPFAATAQPPPIPPLRACAAPAAEAQSDSRLADEIAAAERAIDQGQPNVWPKLARVARLACSVGAATALVEPVFDHCFRACGDDDRYVARISYATLLEQSHDLAGAERQYLEAIRSRADPTDAATAYSNYAQLLVRSGRSHEALDLLNGLPDGSRASAGTIPLRSWLTQTLGGDSSAVIRAMHAAPIGGPTDTPLSAIPVEDNPFAQAPFADRIEVSADVWVEPRSEATAADGPHLYYRRASVTDPGAFERRFQIKQGEVFDVVAKFGAAGCRILFRGNRYDLDECPWRTGTGAPDGVFNVIGSVRAPPAFVPTFRPPGQAQGHPESAPGRE